MFNSIRWTLLFWYGLILVLVIVGFGATLYLSLEHETRTERDTRLREWARTVARGFDDRRWDGVKLVLPPTYARALQTSDPEGPYYIVWNAAGRVAARSPANLEIEFPEAFRVPATPKRAP
ncbi:sensor histidine kinase N-terminal domain-containing protein, partial [Singulisphaera rosea]